MYLYFVEKTIQQDMLDFLQGARGQDFHDITLIVDGEPIGAHKVRYFQYSCLYDHFKSGFLSLKVDLGRVLLGTGNWDWELGSTVSTATGLG